MSLKRRKSSLLAKYSLMYEKNPKSRVFAPLAESYRKIGMHDEALKILNEGLKYHSDYVLAYIVLANCYFDLNKFELAYNTLRPFTSKNLDNISFQKLYADICINLGYLEEALSTFKYLLFLNPQDKYIADQVKFLEDDLLLKEDEADNSGVKYEESDRVDDEDQWVTKDFSNITDDPFISNDILEEEVQDSTIHNVSPLDAFRKDVEENNLRIEQRSLDDEYYRQDFDDENEAVLIDNNEEDTPFINHTLVELYCGQHHYRKALEVLEHIISLHPTDLKTKNKIIEIKDILAKEQLADQLNEIDQLEESLIEPMMVESSILSRVELAFNDFLLQIKNINPKKA